MKALRFHGRNDLRVEDVPPPQGIGPDQLVYPVTIWPRIIALVQSGRFPIERLISRQVPLTRAVQEGFGPLLDNATPSLKVLVKL